ncbi:phosphatase PAP2 family protein [Candidatus Daviesbacteria bacterium]|nr:phosphatase PAP2 family protein [Candidatus Daviesbacteria bacterium]
MPKIILFFVFVSFAILAFFAKNTPYFFFDPPLTKFFQSFQIFFGFDFLMKFMTLVGDIKPASLILVILVVLFGLFRLWREGIILFLSVFGAAVLTTVLKELVARSRPDPNLILQIGHIENGYSFPSGHVLTSMGLYGFLLFLTFTKLKKGNLRTILISVLMLFLILMGLSRIYLGAHWFSDTLGSYLLGMIWLFTVVQIYQKWTKPKAQ